MRLIRHSPLYVYCKFYGLSLLVSLFASRPVSGRLDGVNVRRRIAQIQTVARDALERQTTGNAAQQQARFPFALKTFASDADVRFPVQPVKTITRRTWRVLRRWYRRCVDLSRVKTMIRRDYEDVKRFPELKAAAQVRCSNQAHEDERLFVRARAQRIAHDVCLLNRLGVVVADEAVDSRDIPRLAIGGSGGGYRATFGFLSSLQALHQARTLDAAFWLAGVSGSCWTIAALYTVAPDRDPARLVQHYKSVAAEGFHPMSSRALDVVARSAHGVYFLLAPLLSKIREGNVGIGIMDMYATLTTSYQLLSRSAHARPRLSRSTFQFSKIWQRCGLQQGLAAMPIFTAVRVVHPSRSEANGEKLVGQRQSTHHRTSKFSKTDYQWWEMNPLEVGSSDEGAWVPAWSYGRSFVSGRCVSRSPEISLSMLLGQATSAPAGPLTGYITTLLATLPRGTLMSKALASLNDFVRHKRWQRRWGNPIRGADEANPLYGFGARVGDRHNSRSWEGRGRLKLMDSGLSNNLPNHIFTTSARQADIILSFDQSSDVKTGAGRARLDEFARERGLILVQDTDLGADQAAQVFRAWRISDKGQAGLRHTTPFADRRADLYIVYCPLLPHQCQPDFDPTTSTFSTSYNLVWSPHEIDVLSKTAVANTTDYVIPTLRKVYKLAYDEKRSARLKKAVQSV